MAGFGQPLGDAGLAIGAEGKTGKRNRQVAKATTRLGEYGEHIFSLSAPFVVFSSTAANATKIGPQGDIVHARKCARQRVRDLVGVGTAEKRMRVADERDAARSGIGQVEQALHLAGVAVQRTRITG